MNEYPVNNFSQVIDVPREETASLLAKVLAITSLGFLVTAAGVATAPPWGFLPGVIAVFALIFAINFARKRNPGLALSLFLALTYFMGWEIGPLIHHYMQTIGSAVVFNAAAKDGDLVAGAHLAFPGIGHLRTLPQGYAWIPLNYTVMR